MTNSKWMSVRHGLAGIERAESLLLVPGLLPLGLDQMKRILSATACHRAADATEKTQDSIAEFGDGVVRRDKHKEKVDRMAAAILLQSYLDGI